MSDSTNENGSVILDELQENTIALVRAILMLELSKASGGLKPSVAAALLGQGSSIRLDLSLLACCRIIH
jgi:hypothetical protein